MTMSETSSYISTPNQYPKEHTVTESPYCFTYQEILNEDNLHPKLIIGILSKDLTQLKLTSTNVKITLYQPTSTSGCPSASLDPKFSDNDLMYRAATRSSSGGRVHFPTLKYEQFDTDTVSFGPHYLTKGPLILTHAPEPVREILDKWSNEASTTYGGQSVIYQLKRGTLTELCSTTRADADSQDSKGYTWEGAGLEEDYALRTSPSQ
ncbi:hypothetical protein V865_004120 [Kwoniella europaea PYCC6329]|uniref:Uncharacterized protein n=1 Tax=Kwoniella europaea PYCC6329 TaxID=1423913 RepID=A0AAX4KI26_9TREE